MRAELPHLYVNPTYLIYGIDLQSNNFMKIAFLHLSDIHFENAQDCIYNKAEAVAGYSSRRSVDLSISPWRAQARALLREWK